MSTTIPTGKKTLLTAGGVALVATMGGITEANADTKTTENTDNSVSVQQTLTSTQSNYEKAQQTENQNLQSLANSQTAQEQEMQASQADQASSMAQSQSTSIANLPESQASAVNQYDTDTSNGTSNLQSQQSSDQTNFSNSQSQALSNQAQQMSQNLDKKNDELAKDPARTADEAREKAHSEHDKTVDQASASQRDTTKKAQNDLDNATKKANAEHKQTTDKVDKDAQTKKDGVSGTSVINDLDSKRQNDIDGVTKQQNNDVNAVTKPTKTSKVKKADTNRNEAQKTANTAKSNLDKYDKLDKNVKLDYKNGGGVIKSEGQLPKGIIDPHLTEDESNEMFGGTYLQYVQSEFDHSERVNGSLTRSQTLELNRYMLTLINSYRSSIGLKSLIITNKSLDRMIKISDDRSNAGLGFTHTSKTASGKQITSTNNEQSRSDNLKYQGENLGASWLSLDDEISMLNLKVSLFNTLENMLFQDGASGWGHRYFFEAGNIKDSTNPWRSVDLQSMVVSFEQVKNYGNTSSSNDLDPDANMYPYLWVIGGFTPAQDGTTISDTQTPLDTTLHDPRIELQNDVNNTKTALDNANTAYETALSQAQQEYNATIDSINQSANAQIQMINEKFESDTADIQAQIQAQLDKIENERLDLHQKADTKRASTIAEAENTFNLSKKQADATFNSIQQKADELLNSQLASYHDETPNERDTRHQLEFDQFKLQEQQKLDAFSAKQTIALEAFKAKQAKELQQYITDRATGRTKLLNQQAKELHDAPIKAHKALEAFKANQAKELMALKKAHKAEYKQAKAKSDRYLDSINPKKIAERELSEFKRQSINNMKLNRNLSTQYKQSVIQRIQSATSIDSVDKILNEIVQHTNGQSSTIKPVIYNADTNHLLNDENATMTHMFTEHGNEIKSISDKVSTTVRANSSALHDTLNTLPNTGTKTSTSVSIIGAMLLSILSFGMIRRKNQ